MRIFRLRNIGPAGVAALTSIVAALAITGLARAGEMQESGQYVNLTPKVSCSKVGDVEGHVVCSFEAQGVSIAGNGEKGKRVVRGTIDYTNGVGTNQGHSVTTFGDGSTRTTAWEGMAKRDEQNNRYSEGTYTCIGGSGRFEGIKCDGNWRSDYQKAKFSIGKYKGVVTLPK